jgi:RHS repeat-associated protein
MLGRTIKKGDLDLAYSPSGHLARAERGNSVWSFIYDEVGQRLAKESSDGFVAGYFDEGYVDSAGLTQPFQLAGTIVGVIQSGTFRLLPIDLRGTVTGEADGTATIASPFGDRAVHPEISAAMDYVSKGFDADLGVMRMGVRDYDPNISRFLTPDPLFLGNPDKCMDSPVECDLYGYARGSPASFEDSAGLGADDLLTQSADSSGSPNPVRGAPEALQSPPRASTTWESLSPEARNLYIREAEAEIEQRRLDKIARDFSDLAKSIDPTMYMEKPAGVALSVATKFSPVAENFISPEYWLTFIGAIKTGKNVNKTLNAIQLVNRFEQEARELQSIATIDPEALARKKFERTQIDLRDRENFQAMRNIAHMLGLYFPGEPVPEKGHPVDIKIQVR